MKNAYKLLVRKTEGRKPFRHTNGAGRIIIKQILRKGGVRVRLEMRSNDGA
jgi:hypothetical protein